MTIEGFIQNERQLVLSGLCPKCGGRIVLEPDGGECSYDVILGGGVEDFLYVCGFCEIDITVTFLNNFFHSFSIAPMFQDDDF